MCPLVERALCAAAALAVCVAAAACSDPAGPENLVSQVTERLTPEGAALAPTNHQDALPIWGPGRVVRGKGAPTAQTFVFDVPEGFAGPYTLVVESDGAASAVVSLNDLRIFGPQDFSAAPLRLERNVALAAHNTLRVEARGKPGTSLGVHVWGAGLEVERQVSAAGGTLDLANGLVSIDVPADALLSAAGTYRIAAWLDEGLPVIDVNPHLDFVLPVRVVVSPEFWLPQGPAFAIHHRDGQSYAIDDIITDGAGASSFYTRGFSKVSSAYFARTIGASGPWNLNSKFSWDKQTDAVTVRTSIHDNGTHPNTDLCSTSDCSVQEDCGDIMSHLVTTSAASRFDPVTEKVSACTGNPRAQAEASLVSEQLERALQAIAGAVVTDIGPDYQLWINGAYDSSGVHGQSTTSRHLAGRAADLDLCRIDRNGVCNKLSNPAHELNELANLAFLTMIQSAQAEREDDVQVMVFNEWHPANRNHHVHVELTVRCPDPWPVWDDDAEQCRRPDVRVLVRGEAASANAVASTLGGQPGNLSCAPTSNSNEFECTETTDGGLDLALTATVGSGAEVSWSGDCSGSGTTVTFAANREDVDCTATFRGDPDASTCPAVCAAYFSTFRSICTNENYCSNCLCGCTSQAACAPNDEQLFWLAYEMASLAAGPAVGACCFAP